jgi:hypothetical protein
MFDRIVSRMSTTSENTRETKQKHRAVLPHKTQQHFEMLKSISYQSINETSHESNTAKDIRTVNKPLSSGLLLQINQQVLLYQRGYSMPEIGQRRRNSFRHLGRDDIFHIEDLLIAEDTYHHIARRARCRFRAISLASRSAKTHSKLDRPKKIRIEMATMVNLRFATFHLSHSAVTGES